MLAILIQVSLLAVLMFAFARHEADISWPKLFMVFVPLIIIGNMLSYVIGIWALLVYILAMILALKLWFYLDWGKASLISVVHLIISVALAFGMSAFAS